MALLIVRTNPNVKTSSFGGTVYECSICHGVLESYDEAKACAEADYENRTGRKPVPMEV
jgi:hypothetical protein